jgi:hypothetical protein
MLGVVYFEISFSKEYKRKTSAHATLHRGALCKVAVVLLA